MYNVHYIHYINVHFPSFYILMISEGKKLQYFLLLPLLFTFYLGLCKLDRAFTAIVNLTLIPILLLHSIYVYLFHYIIFCA